MDRAQFMGQLKKLLSDISEAERQEALDYYESYFDDAGEENEADVIRELGSPGKVAAIIKADLRESNDKYAEYTELGYEDSRTKEPGQVPDKYTAITPGRKKAQSNNTNQDTSQGNASGESADQKSGGFTGGQGSTGGAGANSGTGSKGSNTDSSRKFGRERAGQGRTYTDSQTDRQDRAYGPGRQQTGAESARSRAERGYHAERKKNKAGIILVLILLVFISPFIKGAVGGAVGVIVTIALLPFLLVFSLGAGAFLLVISAVACVAAGIVLCITYPAAGVLTIGIGCILMAVGILFVVLLVWAAAKILPKLLQKFTDFCYNLLHREKKGGADV